MFFSISLYVSLVIMVLGLFYKLRFWLTARVGEGAPAVTLGQRAAAALGGLAWALTNRRLGTMLKALVWDGLLQRRSLTQSPLAWGGHMLMLWGFLLLLLMHALDKQVSANFFSDYASTLNPYLFLRNLFGIMVVAGVGVTLWRRRRDQRLKMTTGATDRLAIAMLAVIILSGFVLEALKITSQQRFQAMVREYSTLEKIADIQALETYWAADFGLVFCQGDPPLRDETWAKGYELHKSECAQCHSRPQWAVVSYGLSRLFKPVVLFLNSNEADTAIWYLHFLACFAGLAILPWTKFLHLLTSPLLLMIRAAGELKEMRPANQATVRALMLDACTHCGACSVHCSVAVAVRHSANLDILPSEKLVGLRRLAAGRLPHSALASLRDASQVCTFCHRCTQICPVGIDLQELWFTLNHKLAAQGLGNAIIADARQQAAANYQRGMDTVKITPVRVHQALLASALADTFTNCFCCMTCSNVCPVVRHYYPKPRASLDLLPHQIMHSLFLGLKDEAMGAAMTWDCLTCYQCQEACPQGVRVTDILMELRNQAGKLAGQQSGPFMGEIN
jgi:heterodisulfide reductase subunit C/nitrate reductase gamma subunit